jgi:hypothetical protein
VTRDLSPQPIESDQEPKKKVLQPGEELPIGFGVIYTHVTCAHCNDDFEVEGDAEGDKVTCDLCETEQIVRRF